MENKLTLEHLAPYLPYGLKLYHNGYKAKYYFEESISKGVMDRDMTVITMTAIISGAVYKPILRPLSDLSKNRNFLNILNIMDDNFSEYVTVDSDCDIEVECDGYFARCVSLHDCYKAYTELFKNHFDVFGLIEKGLAIDINTIENA